uniref:Iron-sulfur cluster carrier protein n=1 Tax=Candidatus Methanogaster sp. ANME-2c ERB4 TaxID=2759911 RepID=A0A7G9YIV2_9EURY|nr:iron-sulfur cluster carrier protein [Methanosarcinales archaeon ANME-2c ERB4]
MIISIASGKGGTGKTTVPISLALSLSNVQLLDCDVEEPNSHIFLKPKIEDVKPAYVLMPEINYDLCDYCGKCASACEYTAIVVLPEQVMVFPELCHGCGLCSMVCPRDAISENPREIGVIKKGRSDDGTELVYGLLNIGEIMATPLIDRVKEETSPEKTVIVDIPHGTTCPVIAAIQGSDYCVLVTEPTPFGLYDLKLIVEVLKVLKIPSGVVVNKAGIGDRKVYDYCKEEGIPILLEIPYDTKIAEYYSEGVPFVNAIPAWKNRFAGMIDGIRVEL